jgi:hypothetical protein
MFSAEVGGNLKQLYREANELLERLVRHQENSAGLLFDTLNNERAASD